MKPVPYNTGKVLIGCFYDAPARNHMTQEGEFWQSVLLGEHGQAQRHQMQFILCVAILVGLLALIGWLA